MGCGDVMSLLGDFKAWLKLRREEMEIRNIAIGMNSTVDITSDVHIVMLDYDVDDIDAVIESVKELQEFWNLADASIFRTKNGFHVFFWYDHVPYGRLKMIIDFARYVDPMFKYISRLYDHKTIRVAGKYGFKDIRFVKNVPGKRCPTKKELELGSLKKAEHAALLQANISSINSVK